MEVLRKYLALLSLILLVVACNERDEPEPLAGTPELYLIGEFNGEAFEYYAGENGYFNEAYSYTDEQGRTWFASSFKGTENTAFDFEIAFQDNSATSGLISSGNYTSRADTIIEQYAVQFQAPVTDSGSTFLWDFRDGNFSNEENPVYYYPFEKGAYEVCLNIQYPDGCSSQICQTIKPHLQGKLDIITTNTGSGLTILSPQVQGFEAISYEWTLSNGQKSVTKDIAVQNDSAIIEACLAVTNRKSEVYERCIQVIPTGIQNFCATNFDYDSEMVSDTISSGGATGQFTSSMQLFGNDYTVSDFKGNYTEILSSEPYLENENGEATQKIRFKMEVRLEDESGNLNYLNITDGVLAIGGK